MTNLSTYPRNLPVLDRIAVTVQICSLEQSCDKRSPIVALTAGLITEE
jgi:hypothetical protein